MRSTVDMENRGHHRFYHNITINAFNLLEVALRFSSSTVLGGKLILSDIFFGFQVLGLGAFRQRKKNP